MKQLERKKETNDGVCGSPRPKWEFPTERGELRSVLLRGIVVAAEVLGGQDVWLQECDA